MDTLAGTELVADKKEDIKIAVEKLLPAVDAFITSGGAWGSERDLILDVAAELNWQGIYHRVRMGPGKPVGFGLLSGKPFFCLPKRELRERQTRDPSPLIFPETREQQPKCQYTAVPA